MFLSRIPGREDDDDDDDGAGLPECEAPQLTSGWTARLLRCCCGQAQGRGCLLEVLEESTLHDLT